VKWKFYKGSKGWSAFAGDSVFFPVYKRTYDAGNYAYVTLAKSFAKTRISLGAYHFTAGVVASGQKAGGQFSIEQTATKKLTLAADWYTGNHSSGYFWPGLIYKATSRLTLYPAFEIGNSGFTRGNHLYLLEVGWNFN
jgi:hypothetical protein